MFAQSAGEMTLAALPLVLLLLLFGLGCWNVWLHARLRDVLRLADDTRGALDQLRSSRTFEQELRDVVRLKASERFDVLSPADLAALDDALKSRLPELIRITLAGPAPALQTALEVRVQGIAERRLDEVLAGMEDRVVPGLRQRIESLIRAPNDSFPPELDRLLLDRLSRKLDSANLGSDLDAKLHQLLLVRLDALSSAEDQSIFEDVDARLCECVCDRVEAAEPGSSPALDQQIDSCLEARLTELFENAGDHESLFESIDEKLLERILEVIEEMPDEPAQRIDDLICEELAGQIEHLFGNATEYETLFQSIDEKVAERILRVADHLPAATAERIDANICEQLVSEVEQLFENPEQHEETFETVNERFARRIVRLVDHAPDEVRQKFDTHIAAGLERYLDLLLNRMQENDETLADLPERAGRLIRRRIQEELEHGGRDGLIDRALLGLLAARAKAELEQSETRDALQRTIDTRIQTARERPSEESS